MPKKICYIQNGNDVMASAEEKAHLTAESLPAEGFLIQQEPVKSCLVKSIQKVELYNAKCLEDLREVGGCKSKDKSTGVITTLNYNGARAWTNS